MTKSCAVALYRLSFDMYSGTVYNVTTVEGRMTSLITCGSSFLCAMPGSPKFVNYNEQ